jgi:hypothetical protein
VEGGAPTEFARGRQISRRPRLLILEPYLSLSLQWELTKAVNMRSVREMQGLLFLS